MPPLSERRDDLPELIRHFVEKESHKMGLEEPVEISPEAMSCLLAYNWPGNVRELQNAVARSLILSEDGNIGLSELPSQVLGAASVSPVDESESGESLKQRLRSYERAIIRAAIDEADGDRKLAANRLGIGVSSLYRKLENQAG